VLTTEPFEKLTIGVLLGGQSSEREVSLRSGSGVVAALERLGLRAIPVDPGPDPIAQLREARVHVVFNMLHGGPGENGAVQGLLDVAGIPYTGSGVLASALAMNKPLTKRVLRSYGLPTPDWVEFSAHTLDGAADRIVEELGVPVVVKPFDQGSSVGVEILDSVREVERCIASLATTYQRGFAERFISGTEITVGILGYGERTRALPVLELVPKKRFYDYEAKYTKGMTELICPARLSEERSRAAQEIALQVHRVIGCHGISRVDMHVGEDGQIWVHEINSVPGMTETSDVPAEAAAAGISYEELVLEILHSALPRMAAARPGRPLPAM
jgi:D-alanine-D-alanine ligase